ncbi:MAG: HD domain-containing phosphohydrolase [Anaerolineales bacterium]
MANSPSGSSFRTRPLVHTLAISAIYLLVFIALDFASTAFQSQRGITIWYPPDGVTLALLLVLGPRFIFLPVIGSLVSSFFIYGFNKVEPLNLFAWAVGLAILFGLTASVLRNRNNINRFLISQSEVLKFVIAMFLLATPPAFFSVLVLQNSGQIAIQSFGIAMLNWWIGEVIGLLVIAPFILCAVIPIHNEKINLSFLLQRVKKERFPIAIIASYLGMMWIVFISGFSLQYGLYYLLFLPLILAIFRYGLRGSVTLTFLINGGAMILFILQDSDIETIRSLQVFMAVLAITGLHLGVAVDEKQRSNDDLLQSNKLVVQKLGQLSSLRKIDLAILGTTDLSSTLSTILKEATLRLRADLAFIHIINPSNSMLEQAASIGERHQVSSPIAIRLGDGPIGIAALERQTISRSGSSTLDIIDHLTPVGNSEDMQSLFSTPLISKGNVIGTLSIAFRSFFRATQEWLVFFEALAGQAAMAIDSSTSFESLIRSNLELALAYDNTIEGWSRALDLRDEITEGHTQRVTNLTLDLAREAGVTASELVHVRRGALLHDIGKMAIPDVILHKPDKLTAAEWVVMRKHPTYAYELLSPITYLHPALDIPYCHHEKWDGSGYPRGLQGDQIPYAARLFAVADVWDALTSNRPYRKAWSEEKTLEHIRGLAGTHFDSNAVDLLVKLLKKHKTKPEHQEGII